MMKLLHRVALLTATLIAAATIAEAQSSVRLQLLGYTAPADITTATEQVAYDDTNKVAYLVGGNLLYVVDLSPSALGFNSSTSSGSQPGAADGQHLPLLAKQQLPTTITDVAVCGGLLAVSAEGASKVLPGQVLLYSPYDRSTADQNQPLSLLANLTVGSLPDQLEFSQDCSTILVSNEGEPDGYQPGSTDPEGSVSVVNLKYCPDPEKRSPCRGAAVRGNVRTAKFTAWNDKKEDLIAAGVKINGPGATVAQDLEPEYATFSEDETTAFVALQENNAIAVLDVKSATITGIFPLGLKDHSQPANALDPSDRDGGPAINTWPVHGLFMPDEIKSFRHAGADYIVTANEGDARDYDGFAEETNVAAIASQLNPTAFGPNATARLAGPSQLGRLTVIRPQSPLNDADGDGLYDRILSYGARSFSIMRVDYKALPASAAFIAAADGRAVQVEGLSRVFDSGAQLELISRDLLPALFNSEGTSATRDRRSDNKGPEPEGVAIGDCSANRQAGMHNSSRRCLFLTTERLSAVFVYDISDPTRPTFQSLALPPQLDAADERTRFVAPEGITYARYTLPSSAASPGATVSAPLVLVAYEGAAPGTHGLGVYRLEAGN